MQPINIINGSWKQGVEPKVVNLTGTAFMEEAGAHVFHISAEDASGAAIAFTGTVSALFLRADNTTVAIDGEISEGAAEVTLVSDCYHVPGRFSIAIYVTGEDEVSTCVYAAVGNIFRTSSEVVIDSGAEIPSLAQLQAAYANCVTAAGNATSAAAAAVGNFAVAFAEGTANDPGTYVTYSDGKMYYLPDGHTANVTWANTTKTEVKVGGELTDLKGAFETVYERKNLLPINGGSVTLNGVTVSYSDGVLTANGTASGSGGRLTHIIDIVLPAGTYTFTRTPSYVAIFLEKASDDSILINLNTVTASGSVTLASETACYIGMNVISGTTYNYSMDVQIEEGSTATAVTKPSTGTALDMVARADIDSVLTDISNNTIPTTLAGTLFPADLNNAEIGRVSRYAGTATNAPNNKQGSVFTLKGTSDTGFQIAIDSDGAIYKRVYWGSWGAWEYVNTLTSTTIISDYNNAVVNKVNRVAQNSSNAPSENAADVVTFMGFGGDNKFQIAVDTTNHMYTRMYWGNTWMPWKSYVETRNSQYTFDVSPASISSIPKIGVIGDSFASGEIKVNDSFIDIFSQSWIQIIARKNGILAYNFSQGGLTSKQWMDASTTNGITKLLSTEKCNLYVIAMGINEDKSVEAIGTIDDVGTSADTFYRYYSDIISSILTYNPHAKIIAIKGHTNLDAAWNRINTAIQNIADYYQVPTVAEYNDPFFQSEYFRTMISGHPTTSSYGGMANALQRMIEDCMATEYEYFYDVNYSLSVYQ